MHFAQVCSYAAAGCQTHNELGFHTRGYLPRIMSSLSESQPQLWPWTPPPLALLQYLTKPSIATLPQSYMAYISVSDGCLCSICHSVHSNLIKVIFCMLDRYLTRPHGRTLANHFIVIGNYGPRSVLWWLTPSSGFPLFLSVSSWKETMVWLCFNTRMSAFAHLLPWTLWVWAAEAQRQRSRRLQFALNFCFTDAFLKCCY